MPPKICPIRRPAIGKTTQHAELLRGSGRSLTREDTQIASCNATMCRERPDERTQPRAMLASEQDSEHAVGWTKTATHGQIQHQGDHGDHNSRKQCTKSACL